LQATAYKNGTKTGYLAGQSFDSTLHQYITIQRQNNERKLWLSRHKYFKTGICSGYILVQQS